MLKKTVMYNILKIVLFTEKNIQNDGGLIMELLGIIMIFLNNAKKEIPNNRTKSAMIAPENLMKMFYESEGDENEHTI